MNNERRIAIAIGSKFRDAMDKSMRPQSFSEEELMSEVSKSIDTHYHSLNPLGVNEEIPQDFLRAFKGIIFRARMEIYEAQQVIYDKMLPKVVSDSMHLLEEYFSQNYSETELEEIANFVTTDAGKKLIADNKISSLLHDQRDRMRNALNEEVDRNEATERMNEEISNLLMTLAFRRSEEENDHGEDHDYEW